MSILQQPRTAALNLIHVVCLPFRHRKIARTPRWRASQKVTDNIDSVIGTS